MSEKEPTAESTHQEGCCCGAEDPAAGDAYRCSDDAYAGPMRKVDVDFLYLDLACCDRCQGADKRVEAAVERCRGVLAACGYDLALNSIHVDSAKLAKAYRFESSPTIRVNGADICPSVEENDCACCSDMSDTAVTCRIFPFNGAYYEVPPTDLIVRGIMEAVMQDRQPDDTARPYELPENLARFYAGVQEKSRAEAGCCCGDASAAKPRKGAASEGSCCC